MFYGVAGLFLAAALAAWAAALAAGVACAVASTSKPQSPSLYSLPLFWAIYFLISAWRRRIRVSASAINLAAVAHAVHAHNPDFIGNLINHAVIAHADAPVMLAAGKFAATGWTWIVGKSANGGDDAVVNLGRKPAEVFLGSAFEEDTIHGQLLRRPAR